MTPPARRYLAAALAVVPFLEMAAGAAPRPTAPPYAARAATARTVTVPVDGGGQVSADVEAGATAPVRGRRVATWPPSSAGPRAQAGPAVTSSVKADAPPGDEAAAYPLGAPATPGTIVSVAGGSCEGYAATEATISPLRVAVAPNGDVYWVERDIPVKKHGSLLVRTIDANGRVRTLTSVLPPVPGRHNRQLPRNEWVTSLAATDRGVYYTYWSHISGRGYTDTPVSGAVNFVDRAGKITHIAGGGWFTGKDAGSWKEPRNADGRTAKRTFIGHVTGIAIDADENVYWAEGLGMSMRGAVKFLNRGRETKVFYPGTTEEVRVEPGRVMTIVNWANADDRDLLREFPVMGEQPDLARRLRFQFIPSIALRGDLLYVLNVALFNQADNGPPGTPIGRSSVHAVNLGGAPVRAHGVTIQPAYGDYVAGTPSGAEPGYNGDLRPARGAQLNLRWSAYNGAIAIGNDGALLISDTRNHRLRSVDPDLGLITTLAGTGQPGHDDGGRPALSRLWNPVGISVRSDGAVVFADHTNMRIRVYTNAATPLATIAGRGRRPCGIGRLATGRTALGGAYFGAIRDVGLASNGDLFVADGSYNQIVRIGRDGVVDPVTIGAGIECGAGRYADLDEACPDYGEPAGDDGPFSSAVLAEPGHVVVDSYDNLYISDLDRVRYVNRSRRPVSVLGVTVRPRTIASVIVFPNRRVELVNAAGVVVEEELAPIGDIALDDRGNLFVADPMLNVVYRRGPCGDLSVVAGTGVASDKGGEGDGGFAIAANVTPAGHLAYDRTRDVLLLFDYPKNATPRVRAVSFAGKRVTAFGVAIAPDRIETIAGGNGCEARLQCSYGDGGDARLAGLAGSGLAVSDDRLYIADSPFHRIRVVDARGRIGVVVSPVPENPDGRLDVPPSPFDPVEPSGYGFSGDGGAALRAGIDLAVNSTSMTPRSPFVAAPPTVVSTGMTIVAGDLAFADSGRVRLVRGADAAPVDFRPSLPLPRIAAAVPAFDVPLVLRDERATETAQDAGVTYPSLRVRDGVFYVAAGRGAGRGCDLWEAAGDTWRDAAWQPAGTDAAGAGVGGRRCGLDVTGDGVRVVTDVDRGDADDGTAVRVATAVASRRGGVWTTAVSPGGSTEPQAVTGSTVATAGGRTVVAYSEGSRVRVAAADTGGLTAVATIDVEPVVLGDLVADGARLSLPLVAWPAMTGDPALLVATSADGGTTWRTDKVADVVVDVGLVAASRPSLAVHAKTGTRYVAWSDARDVRLATERAGRWSAPVRVSPKAAYSMLPGVTVARDGRAVVAYYAVDAEGHEARQRRRGVIDDYASYWNVLVSVVDGGRSESYVASTQGVHLGELCLGAKCANDNVAERTRSVDPSDAGRLALGGNWRDFGPVAVAIGPLGEVAVAYTRDRVGGAGGSSGTVVALTKECGVSLLTGRALPACGQARPPFQEPAVRPPDDGVPDLPRLQCSPKPPPFGKSSPRPVPAEPRGPDGPEGPADDGSPRTFNPGLALVPAVPALPAFPAGHAPANAPSTSQVVEHMTVTQNAAQPQPGLMAGEDEQVEEVTEYAFADRSGDAAAAALLGFAAFAVAGAATALRLRERAATESVRVRRSR